MAKRVSCPKSITYCSAVPTTLRTLHNTSVHALTYKCSKDGSWAKSDHNQKSWQHTSFPSGPPPQYSPCLKSFNFGVRKGSGAFGLVWPTAITYPSNPLIYSLPFQCDFHMACTMEWSSNQRLKLEYWYQWDRGEMVYSHGWPIWPYTFRDPCFIYLSEEVASLA